MKEITSVPIGEVKENPANPRHITKEKYEKLKKSISEFPKMLEIRPLVIDQDGFVLGGNMRLKALKELGYSEVPVVYAGDLSEEEVKRFIITDNLSFGEWDWDRLANEWDAGQLADWGLDALKNYDLNPDDVTDEFELASGDRKGFQQMTFTLSDEQVEAVKDAIRKAKETPEYTTLDMYGNENSNGNALFCVVKKYEEC